MRLFHNGRPMFTHAPGGSQLHTGVERGAIFGALNRNISSWRQAIIHDYSFLKTNGGRREGRDIPTRRVQLAAPTLNLFRLVVK